MGGAARWADRHAVQFFLLPTFLVLFALTIFPLFYSLVLSLHKWNMANRKEGWVFRGLGNYVQAFTDPGMWAAAKVTVMFLVLTVAAEFILGLAIALLLQKQTRGVGLTRTMIMLPMMTTPVVIGLIWRLMYNPQIGWVNYALQFIGIKGTDWLGNLQTGLLAVAIAEVWEWTPFVVLIMLAALQSLPKEPYEAASIDGASATQVFRYITWPLLMPATVVTVLIRVMDSFKAFDIIYVLTNGGPGTSTQVLSLYTYKWGFKFFQLGYASALSYVMLIFVIIFANVLIALAARRPAAAYEA